MGNIHLHHVDHSGANRYYYLLVLKHIKENPSYGVTVTTSNLSDFIREGVPAGTDVISYQTFPDENNSKKYNPKVIEQSDRRFHAFKGQKILVDTHDCGDEDAFSRMASSHILPKVKSYPTKFFLKGNNVILVSAPSTKEGVLPDEFKRTINVSCKFGKKRDWYYGHPIRAIVTRYLEESFSEETDFEWVNSKDEYYQELRRTRIVVGAPGWGRYNGSYWGALKAGALLFAHRSLNEIQMFPHARLVDGHDYVSYDLFDFKTKLYRILHDEKEFDRIRNNGREKFKQGLNYEKSADQLTKFLKGEKT